MGHHMNRKSVLTERKLARAVRTRTAWRVVPAAFVATLMALPLNAAVVIPGDPLASGVRVAPNILFILDDSGSMASDFMPDNVPATTTPDVSDFAYTRNSLSYNPAVEYLPWVNADGNRLSGGTSYNSAYSDTQKVNYTGVRDNGTTGVITTSGTTNLSNQTRTFYVPIDSHAAWKTVIINWRSRGEFEGIYLEHTTVKSEAPAVVRRRL